MKKVKIKKITKLEEKLDRYDLTVSSTGNFFANGILIHNTSWIAGKVKTRNPKKIAFHKRLWNDVVDTFGIFKNSRFIDYTVDYDVVYLSRNTIKNKYNEIR